MATLTKAKIVQIPRQEDAPIVWKTLYLLSKPYVKAFESDWYHDAIWIQKWLPEIREKRESFFYGARECGTHIGLDERLTREHSEAYWEIRCDYERRWDIPESERVEA